MFSIGIDIGTENSASAITRIINGKTEHRIIGSDKKNMDEKSIPSYIAFVGNNKIYVGSQAKKLENIYPDKIVSHFKRKIGTDYLYKIDEEFHSPQELTALLIERVRIEAEKYLNDKIKDAVITVPAYFNDNQRNATKMASEIAGIKVKRLINEPTAAAIAYGFDKFLKNENVNENVMVYDLGAGTLDVTVLNINKRVFNVLSTAGNISLGGMDMDKIIENYFIKILKDRGINYKKNSNNEFQIRKVSEYAKIWLSYNHEFKIKLNDLIKNNDVSDDFTIKITQEELNNLILPIIKKSFYSVDEAMDKAKLSRKNIDQLILIGGPTKIPFLRKSVEDYTGLVSMKGIDPMEAVALGASIIAASPNDIKEIINSQIKFKDVTPLTLGNVIVNDLVVPMIPANTKIPYTITKPFTTVKDYQREIVIKIVQGERPIGSFNELIGEFRLTNLKPGTRGSVKINVTYHIDRNGILKVTAKDADTGSENQIIIKSPVNIDSNKLNKIKNEVNEFYLSDMEIKKFVETIKESNEILYRLKNIANYQSISGTNQYYNISQDIIELAKNIKEKNVDILLKMIKKLKNSYNII